jgi:hypothetical protein
MLYRLGGFVMLALAAGACQYHVSVAPPRKDPPSDAGLAGDTVDASGPKRVFLTDALYTADLRGGGGKATGLEGADEICNKNARGATLGGTWKAWLSDSTTNAIDRIAEVGPWQNLIGELVFANKDSITTVGLRAAIGSPKDVQWPGHGGTSFTPSSFDFWAGSTPEGLHHPENCANWTLADMSAWGRLGYAQAQHSVDGPTYNGVIWDATKRIYCSQSPALVCFEQ